MSLQHSLQRFDAKKIYKLKGWTATSAIGRQNSVEVKLTIDHRYNFGFFNKFNDEEKRKVKYLGIDRSNAYKAAAIRHIPHIKVCYDAYHLVSNMNEVLDKYAVLR